MSLRFGLYLCRGCGCMMCPNLEFQTLECYCNPQKSKVETRGYAMGNLIYRLVDPNNKLLIQEYPKSEYEPLDTIKRAGQLTH